MAEPAARQLGDGGAERRQQRGQYQRDLVAYAAGRMLVDARAGQPRQVHDLAGGDDGAVRRPAFGG